MKIEFILLFCILFNINFSIADDCSDMVINGTCDFYTNCLETKYHCGHNGYPVGYGHKYCSKFLKNFNDYPNEGQEWITKTLVCLKKALIIQFTSCAEIYNTAFDSHPRCYYESGFCNLFLDTKNLKQTLYALLNTYEIKDFASITSMKQIFLTAKLCGTDYTQKMFDIIKEKFSYKQKISNMLKRSLGIER